VVNSAGIDGADGRRTGAPALRGTGHHAGDRADRCPADAGGRIRWIYLILPRLTALFVAMPLLTVESIAVGIGAGYLVGVYLLDIDAVYLWHNMSSTQDRGLNIGLTKSMVFGGIIAIIGCYKGMNCGEGAEGVGAGPDRSVVIHPSPS